MATPTQPRTEPRPFVSEHEMLADFLDFDRATLLWKCEGLADAQLKQQPIAGCNLSLLGLVRHLVEVERGWFHQAMANEPIQPLYYTDDNLDGDFLDVDQVPVTDVFQTYQVTVAHSRDISASVTDLAAAAPGRPARSVRWIMLHMIEEYARHLGHADLLREAIDGVTGH